MRCHYEVLSVSHDADDTEIKKSYRKLALQYHPDKNPDNIEDVTEIFREVQSAYDVLSDPQERAWYDKHKEAILKGGGDYVDDALDVMHYFNPCIFCGFDDASNSFYTVFRDAFCKLSKEDEAYTEDDGEEITVPEFGYSYSDYETVVKPFYIYWLAYKTKKSFVWKEKYDIRQAANRPTQRLMEKENKKLRDSCRKKRNEEVRALVSYVRKRDKRVQEELKKMKLKQEEQQRKTKEIQDMQKKDRSKILDNYEEQEWMVLDDSKLDDIDSHYDNMFGSIIKDDSDESDYENVLYCIACDKNFKSDKALENHEKSKKHKENVDLIKNELEDDLFEELHISNHTDDEIESDELADHICESFVPEDYDKNSCLPRLSSFHLPVNIVKRNVIEKNTKSGEDYAMATGKKLKQKKKKRGNILLDITEDFYDEADDSDTSVKKMSSEEDCNDNNENEVKLEINDKNMENITKRENEDINEDNSVNTLDNNIDAEPKADIHEDEGNNKKDNPTNKDKKNKKNDNVDDVAGSFNCEICTKVFPTRNKLFKHIKAEGHAMLKENTKKTKKDKGKKK